MPNIFMATSVGNFLINTMINLCLMLDVNAFSDLDTGQLQTWSDPTDGREAIYLQAPQDACKVTLDPDTLVVTIEFSDACYASD